MIDIYEEISLITSELEQKGYKIFSDEINEAKASGCVATEILFLVREELKRYPLVLDVSEKELGAKIEELLKEISLLLK